MNKKVDCRIVKDLLPNYMDNLLSDYSKKIVEEHFKECNECESIYKDMSSEISETEVVKNNIDTKKFKRFLKKTKIGNMIIGVVIATILFAIIGVTTWGWYKSEYLAENVVVPSEHIVVLETKNNGDGTIYVKIAADTDYRVGKMKIIEDENNPETFIIQMFHSKKVELRTESEKDYYEGYSVIFEKTVVIDTNYHEYNVNTGTYPFSDNDKPQNEIAKNMVVYVGPNNEDNIVIWTDK